MFSDDCFNEMYAKDGGIRPHYQPVADWLAATPRDRLDHMRQAAHMLFYRVGITFSVNGDEHGTERLIPFDILPHIIPMTEWRELHAGLKQRVRALNMFLHDIYHAQEILKANRIPAHKVLDNAMYRKEMQGVTVPREVYAHIAGIDIVRAGEGEYYVLEDNLRTPSGVSYMIEDRKIMMRLMPELFAQQHVQPIEHFPDLLLNTLRGIVNGGIQDPTVVLLTPGQYNSAYFEHAFLAQQMGVELVEGADLFVKDGFVYMRTTGGPEKVDVIYRRVDDEFLDPAVFRADSMLGVPGLVEVYRHGRVALANAIGTGIADDKSIYPYVPEMIRFYLGEEPKIANVPTWLLEQPDDCAYVLEHLDELVVKEAQGSGGYGMLIGPTASAGERESYKQRILETPHKFIAQPTLALSTCPTFVEEGIAPRHIDLRPFILSGKEVVMVPGGLTRVALKGGSLVVNSSQGGGTKDTWVVA
jgi:uncharacterized circularly permuted ATP-grasp superfamily protein